MEPIGTFQINTLRLEGFKCFKEPTTFHFGGMNLISGHNVQGKSSIADAIAFAITGVPFFGGTRIDRLYHGEGKFLQISMTLEDADGNAHTLYRRRDNDRMDISWDNAPATQTQLTQLFGQRDLLKSQIGDGRLTLLAKRNDQDRLTARITALEERRTAGLNIQELTERLPDLYARYEELCKEAPPSGFDKSVERALLEVTQKLAARQAEPYAPKYGEAIAALDAEIESEKTLMGAAALYSAKRVELLLGRLKMNRVAICLYEVVKTTGEVKDTFKFTYEGRPYSNLSTSEQIRAGLEVAELIKRLAGCQAPVFIDNGESVPVIDNVRPSGQVFLSQVVKGAALEVQVLDAAAKAA